ncbi:hypothetical protein SAMN05421869_14938 [Nonomuraea jiangxiensis]|uniref:Uncharacterized protein n=1 Tax=Nonomuraea jiangxiensis TaxID=633440 RepID=A0A1G9UPE7_9ACTN|nr:hypothetical protein SAMN05421869_14938 [Nonomuraea jiangxiensis]
MQVIDHYRDVLRRVAWLDALCWIVVQPLGEHLGLDDVLWRVNGGRDPEQRVMAYPPEEALEAEEPVLFAFEGDGAWGLLEFTYGYGLSDQVLATVSEGARVWMASWRVTGGHTVVYAADGRIRARMWEFVFGDRREEDGDPSALAGLRTLLDGLARDDFDGKRAAVFAFTEQTTGVGFDADQLLAENAPVIVLDVPRP